MAAFELKLRLLSERMVEVRSSSWLSDTVGIIGMLISSDGQSRSEADENIGD